MSFGGGKKPVSQQPTKALGIDFQGAQYGPPIPVVYGKNKVAGNCIWYGDFQAIAVQQQQSSGKGGGSSTTTTSYTYKASYQLALCEGPIASVGQVFNGTSTTTVSAVGGTVAVGNIGQAAWAHLSGSPAIGYSNTALISFQSRDLGSMASLPNDNFEVNGLLQYGSGIVDANPAAVFSDILSDTQHGLAGVVTPGDLTQWSKYCIAAGLFVSPVYDQQDTAQSSLEDLLNYCNAAAWFSEGVLKVGCYGDQTITGNGVTYTPNITSVASLTPDDFITNGSTPPVGITRKSPAAALNLVRVEFKDRSNTYHDSTVVASFDQDIIANGTRSDDSESVDMATTATVARLISQNMLQRAYYVRNTHEYKLSWRYCYLEPFDIVEITDPLTGLTGFPVRILSVEEDEHGLLDVTAEEFPLGIGHAANYATQPNSGTTVDPNVDPGPVAGPYLFRGPGFLCDPGKPEIWCAVTGNGNQYWAGCDVYLSHDNVSYTYLCSYARQSRYGELTNALGTSTDPDTTHTPNVVLNGHNTQLLGGSQADADQFITLAMIDGEIVSYETSTLASGPSYNLHYLRRGGYGTAIAAHAINAPFVRLDDGILRIPVDPSQIGSTIYLKFLSTNCFGRSPRTLSSETAYPYVVGTNVELPDVPITPDNFAVTPVADGVNITWTNDNPAAVGCTSIEYATASGGPFTVLGQVGPTNTTYHHAFTTGLTYYYRARSRGPLVQSGWSSYTSVLNSTGKQVDPTGTNVPLVNNPFFITNLTGWTSDHSTWVYQSGTNGPVSGTSQYAIRAGSSGTPNDVIRNTAKIPVYQGTVIKAQCAVRGTGTPNGTCGVRISWRDNTDTELSVSVGNTSTGNAINGTYVTGTAPAAAMFAHVECQALSHTTGSYAVDNFAASILVDTLDQVPDGTNYGKTLNSGLQSGIPLQLAGGKNLLPNGGFSSNLTATPVSTPLAINANVSDGWRYVLAGGQQVQYETSSSGTDVLLRLLGGTVIGAGASLSTHIQSIPQLSVPASAAFAFSITRDTEHNISLPAGITVTNRAYIAWIRGNGTISTTTIVDATGNTVALGTVTYNGVSPSDAVSAEIHLQAIAQNTTGSSITVGTSGQLPADIRFYNIALVMASNLDTEVTDGSTYGRVSNNDLVPVSGVNRVGIGQANSGMQIGGVLNLKPITAASIGSKWNNSLAISYSFTSAGGLSATVNFAVTAAALQAGASTVNYSASSASVVQVRGTTATYQLYYTDPNYSGGSQTLYTTTDGNTLAGADGIVWIGAVQITAPTSGSGSGSGNPGGGDKWLN